MDKLQKKLSVALKAVLFTEETHLTLLIHSIKKQPKSPDAKFPAYKMKIGYAVEANDAAVKRLNEKQSPNVIELDVSFNEALKVDSADFISMNLNDKLKVMSYSQSQLVAEKYRSLLQQVRRKRNRRQDVFDIYHLLEFDPNFFSKAENKKEILRKLLLSSKGKDIDSYLCKDGLSDPEIKERSLIDFETLSQEIKLEKKDSPEQMYEEIEKYFQSLPWNDMN